MSTRKAEYVTLDEHPAGIGRRLRRFLFVTRKSDRTWSSTSTSPRASRWRTRYYVQYAHARIQQHPAGRREEAGIATAGIRRFEASPARTSARSGSDRGVPDVGAAAADDSKPHRLTFYLLDLAAAFPWLLQSPREPTWWREESICPRAARNGLGRAAGAAAGLRALGVAPTRCETGVNEMRKFEVG